MVYGGKGVGSQGDGTVQFLAKNRQCQQRLVSYLRDELHMDPYEFTISPQKRITRAIIPVAGFGMRLYPATRLIKKEFFPVVDADGFAKPVILILLEELERAGIEKFCLVISGEEDRAVYDSFFNQQLPEEYLQKIPGKARAFEALIKRLGEKLEYVVQQEKMGFGHAVYQCRKFAGDQPVLLVLGDTIYRSSCQKNCTEQLLNAFEKTNGTTVSIHPVNFEDVIYYGTLTGDWVNSEKNIMLVKEFVEKPSVEYAKEFLSVPCENNVKRNYAIFGEYILMPEVFDALQANIEKCRFSNGEIQLTDALNDVRKSQGLYGFVVNGKAYDVGIPKAFVKTNEEFSKSTEIG